MRRGRRKGCAKPAVTNRPKRSSRCPPHARAAWTGAGRGNAYYGQTAADLAEPFAAEFPLLTSMCARDLMLTLHAPENVGVELVLEDVDLVGGHRDGPFAVAGGTLNLLLDEMDGLAPEARVLSC